ncbi:hypothetical protein ACRAWD_30875 [Caulobacter segnis]
MLDRVASGEHWLAFDMNGSYADWYVRQHGPDARLCGAGGLSSVDLTGGLHHAVGAAIRARRACSWTI